MLTAEEDISTEEDVIIADDDSDADSDEGVGEGVDERLELAGGFGLSIYS